MTALQYHLLALQLSRKDQRHYLPTYRSCLPTSIPHTLIPSDLKVDWYEEDKKGQSDASPSSLPHSWTVFAVVTFFILLLLSLLFPQSHCLTFTQQPAASTSVHDFHILHVGKPQAGLLQER